MRSKMISADIFLTAGGGGDGMSGSSNSSEIARSEEKSFTGVPSKPAALLGKKGKKGNFVSVWRNSPYQHVIVVCQIIKYPVQVLTIVNEKLTINVLQDHRKACDYFRTFSSCGIR